MSRRAEDASRQAWGMSRQAEGTSRRAGGASRQAWGMSRQAGSTSRQAGGTSHQAEVRADRAVADWIIRWVRRHLVDYRCLRVVAGLNTTLRQISCRTADSLLGLSPGYDVGIVPEQGVLNSLL